MDLTHPLPPIPVSLLCTRVGPGVPLKQHLELLRDGLKHFSFKANGDPAPLSRLPKHGGIPVTPCDMIHQPDINRAIQEVIVDFHRYLGDTPIFEFYRYPETIHHRLRNEAGIHDVTVGFDLTGTINILEALRRTAQMPGLDEARRNHPFTALFRNVTKFSVESEVTRGSSWRASYVPLAPLGRAINRGRRMAETVPASQLSDVDATVVESERNRLFGATRPDLEIIMTYDDPDQGEAERSVLSIELKKKENLNHNTISAALEPDSWNDPKHAEKVRSGCLPVREAYALRHNTGKDPFDLGTDHFNLAVSQEWKYMIKRAQQWRVTTSASALVPIKLDRQANKFQTSQDANFAVIDTNWSFPIHRPIHSQPGDRWPIHRPVNAEHYAALTILNMQAGPAHADSCPALTRQIHLALHQYLSDNRDYVQGAEYDSDDSRTDGGDQDASPLVQLQRRTTRAPATPISDASLEEEVCKVLLPAPIGFVHPISYGFRRHLILWGIHRPSKASNDPIHALSIVHRILKPVPILDCPYLPSEDPEEREERDRMLEASCNGANEKPSASHA